MVICAEGELAAELALRFGEVGFITVGIASFVSKAMEMVLASDPELLIMEPYLSGMNCNELTEYLEQNASPYLVKLVVSDRRLDLLAERFLSNGGDLFRLQPIDYSFTAGQIRMLRERRCNGIDERAEHQERLLQRKYSSLLRLIGMPPSIKGFRYARDAAILCMQDPSLYQDFRRELYPVIASRYQTTGSCVERCIRIAVEAACKQGDPELIYRYFHPKADTGTVKNKDLIACLIELYYDQELQR